MSKHHYLLAHLSSETTTLQHALKQRAFTHLVILCQGKLKQAQQWIDKQRLASDNPPIIRLLPCPALELNNFPRILTIVQEVLREMEQDGQEKDISYLLQTKSTTLNLAVALASMDFPNLPIRLLHASKGDTPLSDIEIPFECLKHLRGDNKNDSNSAQVKPFDYIFHLQDNLSLDVVQCMRLFPNSTQVLVHQQPKLRKADLNIFELPRRIDTLLIDESWSSKEIEQSIYAYINAKNISTKLRLGINIGGDSALLRHAALNASKWLDADVLQIHHGKALLTSLNKHQWWQLLPIPNVETFLKFYRPYLFVQEAERGIVCAEEIREQRGELLEALWEARASYASAYKQRHYGYKLSKLHESGEDLESVELNLSSKQDHAATHQFNVTRKAEQSKASISIRSRSEEKTQTFHFEQFPRLVPFLQGAWLEEYCYLQLDQLRAEGLIIDLRLGLVSSFKEKGQQQAQSYREFDLVFTDGYQLYIIECKSGLLDAKYIDKLIYTAHDFGAEMSQAALICTTDCLSSELSHKLHRSKIHCNAQDNGEHLPLSEWLRTLIEHHEQKA